MQQMQQHDAIGANFSSQSSTSSKKYKIALAVLAVLAVGGIGFGVFGMVQANGKSSEIASLKEDNAKKTEAINKIEENLGTEVIKVEEENGAEKVEIVEIATTSSDQYVYVGQWGIKLKIPDEIGSVQYTFNGYATNQAFCVSGQKKGAQSVSRFADLLGMLHESPGPMGCLTRTTDKTGPTPSATRVYEDDNYSYVYAGPQALMGDSWTKDEEVETVGLIKKMLTENISKF